jgi:CBS domain-containing protein
MTETVLAVTAHTPLDTALRVMIEAGVHHLPVMDGEHCLGLLHESDILWTLWTHGQAGHHASRHCRRPARSVGPDDSVACAAARISADGGDAVLVTANGSIVGIVTAVDIVRHLASHDRG